LSFAIAFVREITRSKSVTRFTLWDAMSQSVDGIGEAYARLVFGVAMNNQEGESITATSNSFKDQFNS